MISTIVAAVVLVNLALAVFTYYISHRIEASFPPQGKFVEVGADRLHYVEYGSPDKPAVVFVHGLGGQWRNFVYLDLKGLAQDYRVIAVDRPGAGQSIRGARSRANIYAQADTIARFIETLGLDKPVVIGHSLGGAITLGLALNHPQHLRRAGLIAPLTMNESEPPEAFRGLRLEAPLLRRYVSLTLGIPVMMLFGRKGVMQVFAPEAVPRDFPTRGGGLTSLRSCAFYSASTDLVAAPEDLPDMERRYASLTVPVDMLFGREDAILPFRKHAEGLVQKLPSVNLRAVSGGHMLPVTQAADTTAWVREVMQAAHTEQSAKTPA